MPLSAKAVFVNTTPLNLSGSGTTQGSSNTVNSVLPINSTNPSNNGFNNSNFNVPALGGISGGATIVGSSGSIGGVGGNVIAGNAGNPSMNANTLSRIPTSVSSHISSSQQMNPSNVLSGSNISSMLPNGQRLPASNVVVGMAGSSGLSMYPPAQVANLANPLSSGMNSMLGVNNVLNTNSSFYGSAGASSAMMVGVGGLTVRDIRYHTIPFVAFMRCDAI